MTKEMDLLNSVRLALQDHNCKSFRINVGSGFTKQGNYFTTGVPVGFSDLLVVRQDAKACFIETKIKPRKPTKEQCSFMLAMIKHGCPAGVAYSVEDALKIVEWQKDFANYMREELLKYGNKK